MTDEQEGLENEPFGEDGPTEEGFHKCTPFNGGHSFSMPYRKDMSWVARCNKCLFEMWI